LWHLVVVGYVSNVSEIHAASISNIVDGSCIYLWNVWYIAQNQKG
jgi:hypothetical protein